MPKEFKEINFSVRTIDFASLQEIARRFNISNGNVSLNVPAQPVIGGNTIPDTELQATKQRLLREINDRRQAIEGTRGIAVAGASSANATRLAEIAQREQAIRDIDARRMYNRIQGMPGARGQLGAQMGEVQSQIRKLTALGVDPTRLTNINDINRELRIRNMPLISNVGAVARPVAPVAAATPAAGNAFDRTVRRLGGVAKRHPVMAVLGGLAAIGGAVKISKAQEAGRIDADSYYIMDNNTMSMVPRAFPSREAAMQIRNESYPGAAINKGSTLISKA